MSLWLVHFLALAFGIATKQADCFNRNHFPNHLTLSGSVNYDQRWPNSQFTIFTSRRNISDPIETIPSEAKLSAMYSWGKYMFGSLSIVLFLMPDCTQTSLLAAKWGGAAGFGIAAGLCTILKDAHKHNRLGSDTYKRLSLALLGFNVIGLTAVPGEAAFLPNFPPAFVLTGVTTILRMFGIVIAFQSWKKGVIKEEGSDDVKMTNALVELRKGTINTLKGLRVRSVKKALAYLNCFLLVCLGILSAIMEGIFNMQFRERFMRTWFEISLQWSAVSRLFMIASIVYTLKDAAERDRLSGMTFIQLNVMVGIWSILVGLGQSIYPLGIAPSRGVFMFVFSFPFFARAAAGIKEKEQKESKVNDVSLGDNM